ncbi:MAG: endolytic transglycosylase MltG [Bacilli bacterium]|nr:endolytic transglycosylase MltG [Bacilli bacterium]
MDKNKLKIFGVGFFALGIIIILGIYSFYLGPVSKDSGLKEIEVTSGSSYLTIASLLKENNLIKSPLFYKIYVKLNNPKPVEACTYYLSEAMGVEEIVDTLSESCNINPDVVNITFKEGWNMRRTANIIADKTNNTVDSVYELLKDKNYLDELIEKYWFLTSEIKNNKIYYSLEGYLFPNTYQFLNKDVTVKEIFEVMLDETNKQLKPFKEAIAKTDFTIHEFLTFASIVELEGATSDDRASVAGVFYNRLEDGWTLGSDVTGYYGAKMDDWTDGLEIHLNDCNDYNTRGTCVPKLPISPIANPGIESITAVIKPTKHDYYYFVADCDGKTYLNYTEREHLNTISKLKSEDNWCDV